jgi:hypothetical protein
VGRYYATIGDNSSGFVADGDNVGGVTTTIGAVWMVVKGSTVVLVNGERIDMTDAEVDATREVDGWVIVRTKTGVKAKDQRRRR